MAKVSVNQRSRTSLQEEFEDFLLDRMARNYTESTLKWYRRCLTIWGEYCEQQGLEETMDVEAKHVRRFLVQLGDRHSKGGIATIYTGVRAYLNWYAIEYAPDDWRPLARIKAPKRPKERLEPLPLDTFQKLVAQTNTRTFLGARDRALLYLLLDTGLRQMEVTNLRVDDLDLKQGQILVRQGKGQKSRVAFIGGKTRRCFLAYFRKRKDVEPEDALWVDRDGHGLTRSGIREIIRRLSLRAGIKEPGLHSFRRAFAVNALRNGMDVIMLQRLMGHADLSTLDRYLELLDDDLRRAHHRLGVVDHL